MGGRWPLRGPGGSGENEGRREGGNAVVTTAVAAAEAAAAAAETRETRTCCSQGEVWGVANAEDVNREAQLVSYSRTRKHSHGTSSLCFTRD